MRYQPGVRIVRCERLFPAPRRKVFADLSPAVDEDEDEGSHEWDPDERVRDATMMLQVCDRTFDAPQDVDVSGFGRQRHCQGRERSPAVEARAPQACAGQKVSDRFQVLPRLKSLAGMLVRHRSCHIQHTGRADIWRLRFTPCLTGYRHNIPTPHRDRRGGWG